MSSKIELVRKNLKDFDQKNFLDYNKNKIQGLLSNNKKKLDSFFQNENIFEDSIIKKIKNLNIQKKTFHIQIIKKDIEIIKTLFETNLDKKNKLNFFYFKEEDSPNNEDIYFEINVSLKKLRSLKAKVSNFKEKKSIKNFSNKKYSRVLKDFIYRVTY